MKQPSEPFVLGVVGAVAVLIICLSGIGLEYGWFGNNIENQSSVTVSHGVLKNQENGYTGRINLNTASKEMLQTLPGIGEKLADAIVEYRMQIGGFTSVSQLENVQGINEETVYELIPYITVE